MKVLPATDKAGSITWLASWHRVGAAAVVACDLEIAPYSAPARTGQMMAANIDETVVAAFGQEWSYFDQSALTDSERQRLFDAYFSIFPWHLLPADAVGFDAGCGSGRWAALVAPRVKTLYCIDASSAALRVAQQNLSNLPNCQFYCSSIDEMPLPDTSCDFGYSLGVLHHMPDTLRGVRACVQKLKPGAPLLIYLYYALDNRPPWFRAIWRASDLVRQGIARLPFALRLWLCQAIGVGVYWPLSRFACLVEAMGHDPSGLPLAAYRRHSLYVLRTDALDRFGTRLERRFSRLEIAAMLEQAGLRSIRFRDEAPFWCAVGIKC